VTPPRAPTRHLEEKGSIVRGTLISAAAVATIALLLGPALTAPASAQGRADDWVEVWCDTDTGNDDGNAITLSVIDGITHGGPDDVLGKVVDASAFDPGNKDSNHFNHRAGVVLGWYCGELRYADGTIVFES
jgi:hypothetical protein